MPVRVNLFDNKLETEVVFDYDPVAISFFARKYISLYNLNALNIELANDYCSKHPKEMEDLVVKASEARTYYINKLMLSVLAGDATNFQKQLLEVLNKEKTQYNMTEFNTLFRVPDMYQEDLVLDEVKALCNTSKFTSFKVPRPTNEKSDITFIGSHVKTGRRYWGSSNKTDTYLCYWFRDEDDRAHLLEMDTDSPFREIWSNLIINTISIKGTRHEHNRSKINFFTWSKYKILV